MSKYKPGLRFNCLCEMRNEKVVWVTFWQKAHPVAFFLSWQWRMVDSWVRSGRIKRAIRKEEKE